MMSLWMQPLSMLLAVIFAVATLAGGRALGQVKPAPPGKDLVAVLDLESTGASKAQVAGVSEQLRADLLNTGRYRLVDRSQMDKVLEEQAFQQTGCTSQDCAVQVGKILGVRKLITGRVTKIEDTHWQVSAILVDVETAETLFAVTVNHEGAYRTLLATGVASLTARLVAPGAPASAAAGTPARATAGPPVIPAAPLGELLATFSGHAGEVTAVAFMPNGRRVLSASRDGSMKLWDVASGREVLAIKTTPGNWVTSLAVAPDGRTVVSGGGLHPKLWDIATGKELRNFVGHQNGVFMVALAPDGKTFLSGSEDKTIKLWNVATDQAIRTFAGHSKSIWWVALAPDGRKVLSTSWDGSTKLWDVATGQEIRTLPGAFSAAFMPDSRMALLGASDGSVKLWDLERGTEVRTFAGHKSTVRSMSVSKDGRRALSGSHDGTMKLWDVAAGREIQTFAGHAGGVQSVAFAPDERSAISGSEDQTLKLWSLGE